MNGRHLHPVEEILTTRLTTREEIVAWRAARRAVLTALVEAEELQLNIARELVDVERRAA